MNSLEAIEKSRVILRSAGIEPDTINTKNFLQYASLVSDVIREWPKEKVNNTEWLLDWAEEWRRLQGEFSDMVVADPMILYEPRNRASLAFHKSPAFMRYFRAGNGTSKTQSGYAEHYFVTTGQHRWRYFPKPPNSSFIIGTTFSQYLPNTFERKLLQGEVDNPLSPMFPEGGKWFYSYNQRTKTIFIACPNCAEEGIGHRCKHEKSTITLYSDEGGWEVVQGAQFRLGHFDEHIDESFFSESIQRLVRVQHSSFIQTGTPLHGLEAWEHRLLTSVVEGDPKLNFVDIEKPETSPPLVSLHCIDQYEANIIAKEQIDAARRAMDEFEIESRIYGRPAPLAKNPVFDRQKLVEMRKTIVDPERGNVMPIKIDHNGLERKKILDIMTHDEVTWEPASDGPVRVWEAPVPGGQYIIGADTAAGLAASARRDPDASCASVLKVEPDGIRLKMTLVAQYHGWINPLDYAVELFKLAVHYNSALVAIELTGGLGRSTMLKLKNEIGYWNIFRDSRPAEIADPGQDARFGVETNASTKPSMVAALQQAIKDGMIKIQCKDTIGELVAFEQEKTGSGGVALLTPRYRGAGGSHDDRVMSLVIAAYLTLTGQAYDYSILQQPKVIEPNDRGYNQTWTDFKKQWKEDSTDDLFNQTSDEF